MQACPLISLSSPSFNSYSSSKLEQIAARTSEESDNSTEDQESFEHVEKEVHADEDHEEFEFKFAATKDSDLWSAIPADEIFDNGMIRPVYPVFNRDLLFGRVEVKNYGDGNNGIIRSSGGVPLRKLFMEERETNTTSSSSSSDDLDGVPVDTYCVWKPEVAVEARRRSGSKSGGGVANPKRGKFRDFLEDGSHGHESSKDFCVFSPRGNSKKMISM